jgi:hypothetical protein
MKNLILFVVSGVLSQQLDKTTLGNIKKITIRSVQNLGKLQDDYDCLSDKGNDEIQLEYESGGQREKVLSESFGVYGTYRVNKDYICQDTGIFHLVEKDVLANERKSFKIGCRESGDFELSPWINIELESKGCYFESTTIKYRIYYEIHEIQ